MDGVLVDSEALQEAAERYVCALHRIVVPEEVWHGFKGNTSKHIFGYINARFGGGRFVVDELIREKIEYYMREVVRGGLDPIPGSFDFLRFLGKLPQIRALALTTSNNRAIQRVVFDRYRLDAFFKVVVTGDDVTHGKPHPEPYQRTLKLLGAEPSKCLVIEDSDNGIISAKAAGCKVLAITTTFPRKRLRDAGADYVVDTFVEAQTLFS